MKEIPLPKGVSESYDDYVYETDLLGFITDAINESEGFLRSQPDFGQIEKSIKATRSERSDQSQNSPSGLSTVQANHIAKAEAQLVSAMTDTRNFMEYRTFNPNFQKQTQILGKISLHIWLQRQWDMRWADMIRNCCTGGSAYAHLTWNSEIMDLDFMTEDVRDVLPIRPADNHTIQTAFGVIIRRERTVNYLRAKYPDMAQYIVADRDGSMAATQTDTRYKRLMDRLGSPFHERLYGSSRPAVEIPRIPTADEYTIYLNDARVNETKRTLYMGNWHLAPEKDCEQCLIVGTPHAINNWSYEVKPGEKIYPNKRLICAINKKILYDNTSPYWHGLYPTPKLTLQPTKDSWIGKGLLWDALPVQKFLDKTLRLIDNHFQKWQQPDLIADKNVTAVSEWNKINTARPGMKLRVNPTMGKPPELRYPDQLPAYVFEMLEWAEQKIGSLTGAHDISQLTKLNQLPSADSVDKIMEAMTPEVRMRSRVLEAFMREFGIITAYNIAQFKTLAERIAILGPGGVTLEDFDYDPGTLIPAYVHANDYENGIVTVEALARGPMPRQDRAKELLRQCSMHIAPGSLLSSSEMVDKLLYLQFARMGFIDPQTLADKFGIPNWGEIPGDTIFAKLMFMQGIGFGAQTPEGRPPTAQEPPKMEPRSDQSGVKVSESG